MERQKCKLCGRNFANGKALGGHMKAHFATLPPVRRGGGEDGADSAFSSSSSSEEEQEQESERKDLLGYGLRENPKRSFRFVDPEFSGSVVQDRESDSESRNPTRKRSKRIQKKRTPPEPEPVSSISDTSPEEDVAMCLMMLSRDVWKVKGLPEESEQEEFKFPVSRGRYRCEKCGMSFRSHSALGGHRRICLQKPTKKAARFQCPFCDRVFGSGQALGGHKRSHMLPSNASPSPPTPSPPEKTPIDLNLPAPIEDDEFSVLSDA